MEDLKKIAEQLASLSAKKINKLVTILQEEHGIEPVIPSPPPAVVTSQSDGELAQATEEKSSFDVVIKSAGASKLAVVKLVKELAGLGIKEAKELVDNAPKPIKKAVAKAEADTLKNKLEEAGAEVELQ